ncbi:MAG: histone deacetylase family protein, partial [Paracoccaceae bacterium]
PGSNGAAMRAAYERVAFPRIKAFEPELIIISAGFDAHQDDPLAELNWSTEDFVWLTKQLCALANDLCEGRLVSALEGGYDLNALAASVKAHVKILSEAAQ